MSYKIYNSKGQICCQKDHWMDLCPKCKVKVSEQEKAIRAANAKRNDMLRREREAQARIDASRGNPGKDNQMRTGQNPTAPPAGCRCGKCGGVKTTAQAATVPAPAASPLRSATIARLSSRLPGGDLNSLDDETLAVLDRALTASASAPAPVLRNLPDPLGVNALLEENQRRGDAANEYEASLRAARERERPNLRPLPDTWGVRAAEARRAEAARNEEAKKLEEQRIAKENSGWDKVNAMLEAAQKDGNKERAAYEALEQARAAARNNPNSRLRELPDPLGLKSLGLRPDGSKI